MANVNHSSEAAGWRARRLCLATCLILSAGSAFAQGAAPTPPLPPARPPELDANAAAAPPARNASPIEKPTQAIPEAPRLRYHRAAMRACAIEWGRLRQEGGARNLTWAGFARECLPKKTPRD